MFTKSFFSTRLPLILGLLLIGSGWLMDQVASESVLLQKPAKLPAALDSLSSANGLSPASAALAGSGFSLDQGFWQIPGMTWTIAETPLQQLPNLDELPSPAVQRPESGVELDHDLLTLIHSAMKRDVSHGDVQCYRLAKPSQQAIAWTVRTKSGEIPLAIQFWWPAYDDLWTGVEARRLTADSATACSAWQLPAEFEITGSRISSDGTMQCCVVSLSAPGAEMAKRFTVAGWHVSLPPVEAGGLLRLAHFEGQKNFFSAGSCR